MEWPKDDKPANFCEIIESLKNAILQGYKLKRINKNKEIKWTGLPLAETATQFSLEETLSKKNLDFSLEDQGRDLMDELLGVAIRLGIEQGRRITIKKQQDEAIFSIPHTNNCEHFKKYRNDFMKWNSLTMRLVESHEQLREAIFTPFYLEDVMKKCRVKAPEIVTRVLNYVESELRLRVSIKSRVKNK